MSVGIGVGDHSSFEFLGGEPSTGFDDDGYYAYLHSRFESLAAKTGQYIDLYGYATFEGESLNALATLIADARREIERRPESWDVHISTQIAPVRKEIYSTVRREEFLTRLAEVETVIARARATGRPIVCVGD